MNIVILTLLWTSSLSKKSAHNIVQQTIVVNRVHRFIYFHEWWHSYDTFPNRRTVPYQRQIFKACSLYFLNSQTSWSFLFDCLKRLLGKPVYTLEDVAKSLLTTISCLNENNSFRQSVHIFCSSVWNSNEVLPFPSCVRVPLRNRYTSCLNDFNYRSLNMENRFCIKFLKVKIQRTCLTWHYSRLSWWHTLEQQKKFSRCSSLKKKDWWNWRWRHLFDVIHLTKNIILIFIDKINSVWIITITIFSNMSTETHLVQRLTLEMKIWIFSSVHGRLITTND